MLFGTNTACEIFCATFGIFYTFLGRKMHTTAEFHTILGNLHCMCIFFEFRSAAFHKPVCTFVPTHTNFHLGFQLNFQEGKSQARKVETMKKGAGQNNENIIILYHYYIIRVYNITLYDNIVHKNN